MRTRFLNSLRFKIGFGYIVLVLINIAVMIWAIYNFSKITTSFNRILAENYTDVVALEQMAHVVEKHERALIMMLNGDVGLGQADFQSAKEEFYQFFDKANEKRELPDVGPILDNIKQTYEGYLLVADSLYLLTVNLQYQTAKNYYSNIVRPFSQRLSDNCFWLIEINQKEMMRLARGARITAEQASIAVLFASVIAIALSIITMIQFTKRIIEPVEKLAQTVRQIGRGRLDLKIDVDTNDEVGDLSREFNKMTERLRKFEKLNIEQIISEKQKSETIVESISDAILVCDSQYKIQLLNRPAEILFNLREEEVVGKKVQDCIKDDRIREIFESAGKTSIIKKPYLQFNNNGKIVYLRPRVSEIPAVHGGRGGTVLILQDVSQFKELDKMKSDFMATVSHEFRTPLTSINMSVDILRQKVVGPLTKEQEELLESSKHDCERLTKLVKELLQLSKLESGKFELKREPVDFQKIIELALQPLQLPFKEKKVDLQANVDPELPLFIGDEQQLTWVVSNLVNNALRYTPEGGKVEVKIRKEDSSGILLTVKDTGRGIQPEHLEKIFDKFVQVKHALDSTPGSVGLGLAIVKEIVELYHGKIWVESEVMKGTTFFIFLPVSEGIMR